jgi:hypothetical protein
MAWWTFESFTQWMMLMSTVWDGWASSTGAFTKHFVETEMYTISLSQCRYPEERRVIVCCGGDDRLDVDARSQELPWGSSRKPSDAWFLARTLRVKPIPLELMSFYLSFSCVKMTLLAESLEEQPERGRWRYGNAFKSQREINACTNYFYYYDTTILEVRGFSIATTLLDFKAPIRIEWSASLHSVANATTKAQP